MKKYLILLSLFLFTLPSFAGGVGYINYEKVVDNYNFAKTSMHEIQVKEREVSEYLKKKEEEFNKLETPIQRKKFEETVRAELQIKEKTFSNYVQKKTKKQRPQKQI